MTITNFTFGSMSFDIACMPVTWLTRILSKYIDQVQNWISTCVQHSKFELQLSHVPNIGQPCLSRIFLAFNTSNISSSALPCLQPTVLPYLHHVTACQVYATACTHVHIGAMRLFLPIVPKAILPSYKQLISHHQLYTKT